MKERFNPLGFPALGFAPNEEIKIAPAVSATPTRTERVWVQCPVCHRPGCGWYETTEVAV